MRVRPTRSSPRSPDARARSTSTRGSPRGRQPRTDEVLLIARAPDAAAVTAPGSARTCCGVDVRRTSEARTLLRRAARVPDDYSSALRAAGLYPLTRISVRRRACGASRIEIRARTLRARGKRIELAGCTLRAAPPAPPRCRAKAIRRPDRRVDGSTRLGSCSSRQRETWSTLARGLRAELRHRGRRRLRPLRRAALAPRRSRAGDRCRRSGRVRAIRLHAVMAIRVLLQIVYTLWFPERPGGRRAIFSRVALDGAGLARDAGPGRRADHATTRCIRAAATTGSFRHRARRPRAAPDASRGMGVRAASVAAPARRRAPTACSIALGDALHRAHRRSSAAPTAWRATSLRRYDELRSLSRMDGSRRGVFGADGLIAGTERGERFLYLADGNRLGGRDAAVGTARDRVRRPSAFRRRRPPRAALRARPRGEREMSETLRVVDAQHPQGPVAVQPPHGDP